MLNQYNEFVKIVFTQKATYENGFKQKLATLLRLSKSMGLNL